MAPPFPRRRDWNGMSRGVPLIMKNLNFSPLKKLEIILDGEHRAFVTDILDRAGVKGYTIFFNLSGKGRHGFHEGHLMFNVVVVLFLFFVVVFVFLVKPILEGLATYYN